MGLLPQVALVSGVVLALYFAALVIALQGPGGGPERAMAFGCSYAVLVGMAFVGVLLVIGVIADLPLLVYAVAGFVGLPLLVLAVSGIKRVVRSAKGKGP